MALRRALTTWSSALRLVLALALLTFVLFPVALAGAQSPNVTLGTQLSGSATSNPRPSFEGTTDEDLDEVTLSIYSGSAVEGTPVQVVGALPSAGSWSSGPVTTLADGTYTAQATQTNPALETGASLPVTFTVDTVAPVVSLNPVASSINDPSPSFGGDAGVAAGDSGVVKVNVYEGSTVSGSPVRSLEVVSVGGVWSAGPVASLSDGVYTVQAEESDAAGNIGFSSPSTFTVDTTPPDVTLSSPIEGAVTEGSSQLIEGTAGTSQGDSSNVTVKLFAGSKIRQVASETVGVEAFAGHWSVTLGGLSEGAYTIIAEQTDDAGNIGQSEPVTFKVESSKPAGPELGTTTKVTTSESTSESVATPGPGQVPTPQAGAVSSPPVASFTWFPSAPHTGETVSVVSSSNDIVSPIATLSWALGGNPFQVGGAVFTTSFATPGAHVVSLHVVAVDGLAATATQKILVSSPSIPLMQPFPIVRIAGNDTAMGAKLTLLTVQAPVGARITIVCRGHGCPAKPVSRMATSTRVDVVLIEFHRFERALGAGAILEIRVSKSGEIGKYTRFQIRQGKLPKRTDSCLSPTGTMPMSCPS
jgi:hypothetical protein